MKILLTYDVSLSVADSFLAALEMQKLYPLSHEIEQLAFSDAPIPGLKMETIIDPSLMTPDGYAHGRARTLAIQEARKSDADYLIMLEADSVFLGFGESGRPKSDFEALKIFFQKEGEIITPEALADSERWKPAGWWVFGRAVFDNDWCVSDEAFVGNGFEDLDFHANVLSPRGIVWNQSSGKAIHLWHPLRLSWEQFTANKIRYEDNCKRAAGTL